MVGLIHFPSSSQENDDSTRSVSTFYDYFPYPADPLKDEAPSGFDWRWSYENALKFCEGNSLLKTDKNKPLRILDAGCGTGVSTNYLAHQNFGSEIIAVDISSEAIKIAKERIARSGATNKAKITLINRSFFDLKNYGEFDYINSFGVLHHLQNPQNGLKALELLLRPGGILHLFLYSEGGRWEIRRFRKAIECFDRLHHTIDVKFARDLLAGLPAGNRIKNAYQDRFSESIYSDIDFADIFLHPKEMCFDINCLQQLISVTQLKFVGFCDTRRWSTERFLNGNTLKLSKKMPLWEQYKLVEYLDTDIDNFNFFLVKDKSK